MDFGPTSMEKETFGRADGTCFARDADAGPSGTSADADDRSFVRVARGAVVLIEGRARRRRGKMLADAACALSRRSASELSEHVGIVAILRGRARNCAARVTTHSGLVKKAAAGSHKFYRAPALLTQSSPPSNRRLAASVSFFSHARKAWSAASREKPSCCSRPTASESSCESWIVTGSPPPPPPPPAAAPPARRLVDEAVELLWLRDQRDELRVRLRELLEQRREHLRVRAHLADELHELGVARELVKRAEARRRRRRRAAGGARDHVGGEGEAAARRRGRRGGGRRRRRRRRGRWRRPPSPPPRRHAVEEVLDGGSGRRRPPGARQSPGRAGSPCRRGSGSSPRPPGEALRAPAGAGGRGRAPRPAGAAGAAAGAGAAAAAAAFFTMSTRKSLSPTSIVASEAACRRAAEKMSLIVLPSSSESSALIFALTEAMVSAGETSRVTFVSPLTVRATIFIAKLSRRRRSSADFSGDRAPARRSQCGQRPPHRRRRRPRRNHQIRHRNHRRRQFQWARRIRRRRTSRGPRRCAPSRT